MTSPPRPWAHIYEKASDSFYDDITYTSPRT